MPAGTATRRKGTRAGTLGRLALMLTAVVTAPNTIATPVGSAAPPCPGIAVVFARGTDEPAGIGVVGQSFVDTLRPMVKGKTLASYAVQYPASWDFAKAAAGATDMSQRVQATAAQCPSTEIVLGGYSHPSAPRAGTSTPISATRNPGW